MRWRIKDRDGMRVLEKGIRNCQYCPAQWESQFSRSPSYGIQFVTIPSRVSFFADRMLLANRVLKTDYKNKLIFSNDLHVIQNSRVGVVSGWFDLRQKESFFSEV